ncbi:hypothetical protein NEIELOOT_01455 [Neisseria elongata subsp. glycolytica ATCC 29315]|uniref:Uncharacterized protein n=1 Tax=Neisseria elongata subsp. glycolytica ATCC 29315 TaxID=546263 RepID=D4DQW5_NEIEG|nr:hypothetical protein NEIELOOT_01455 [Neisseria elongata subsp. glycolytica ATCC 29315]
MQTGNDAERRTRLQILIVGSVVGIDFVEGNRVLQAAFGNQLASGFNVNRAVIAQAHGIGQRVGSQRVKHIAAVSRGNIENMYGFARFAQLGRGRLNRFADIGFALADAAPADGVEIVFVHRHTKGIAALRLVAVHIIQRTAGVVAGFFADFQTFAPARAEVEGGTVNCPECAARRINRQRRGQFVGFTTAFAVQVGLGQIDLI